MSSKQMVTYIRMPSGISIAADNQSFFVGKDDERFSNVLEAAKKAMHTQNEEDVDDLLAALAPVKRVVKALRVLDPALGLTVNDKDELVVDGIEMPFPKELSEYVKEAVENKENILSFVNFFKLLATNPDPSVRERLFAFLQNNGHPITKNGYFVTYKYVSVKSSPEKFEKGLAQIASDIKEKLKRRKESAKSYHLYKSKDGEFKEAKPHKLPGAMSKWKDLGSIEDVITKKANKDNSVIYTDSHTRTMEIMLGRPVAVERDKCDPDHNRTCSYGLHVGNMAYVKGQHTVLMCLVSPADVVSVPHDYNNQKMRTCRYYPYAVNAEQVSSDSKFDDDDFLAYDKQEMEELLKQKKKLSKEQVTVYEQVVAMAKTKRIQKPEHVVPIQNVVTAR